jgi:putative heme-binding domain-containing protein
MIYSIHGDAVDVPRSDILDHTSPLREARRGQKTSEGCLLRLDRDGRNCDLLCGGLRNPFGVAFNPAGDAFTYDADAEHDMGTPWYRPTRVVQLASGADYAWRGVTGQWPPYFPDHPGRAPATLAIGKGSPTAVAFGTGSNFPPPYRDALFILDWAYGRVLAVHVAPRGAGYRAAAETFLKGRPLNVTDLAFGPDGSLYLTTGGRKTQSALYKISYRGQPVTLAEVSRHEQACAAHAAAARTLRQRLEAFHGRVDPAAIEMAWPHLANPDPLMRYAARIAIEHQPIAAWRDKALAEPDSAAALAALTSLVAAADEASAEAIIERLLHFEPVKLDRSQALALIYLYQELRRTAPQAVARQQRQIVAQLEALAQLRREDLVANSLAHSAALRRDLARLLVDLGSPKGMEWARELLASSRQEERLMGLLVLRHVKEGWTLAARRDYFTALNDAAQFVGGDGMPRFLATLREEASATLTDKERQELAAVSEPRVEPEPDQAAPQRPVVKAWALDDLLPLVVDPSRRGDAERGAAVFREALCIRCHRVGARGPAVGPDLTHVSARFSRRDVLQSVLAPSSVVAENYRNVQVALKDGRALVGRVVSEGDYRSETLRLATNPLKPAEILEINKREIERSKLADSSPMPDHLLDTFDQQAILDLLAFLDTGAQAAGPTK